MKRMEHFQAKLLILLLAVLLVPRWAEAGIMNKNQVNYLVEGDSVKVK